MDKHLHIISLTVPYPVDFGGVFDLFYKLPALQQAGVHIHLHCFDYGRGKQPELYKYCASVNYYERVQPSKSSLLSVPYIVSSRGNEALLNNLLKDDYPIFMEGIHCTYLLHDARFAKRRKFVRIHNIEYQYYQHLYQSTHSLTKKLYYWNESRLLRKYEAGIVQKATAFWGVTHKDVDVYRKEFKCTTIDYLSLYLPPEWQVNCPEGLGNFCLYQGDLSVSVNQKAAEWLLKKVFGNTTIPFVIAGKNPPEWLEKLAHSYSNTCIVTNPGEKEMQDLIKKAQINILPSFHNTGIKLKLLNALFNGRHCVVNHATAVGSGLEAACHIAETASAIQSVVAQLFHQPFTQEEILLRKKLLSGTFSNSANAQQQVEWIWGNTYA